MLNVTGCDDSDSATDLVGGRRCWQVQPASVDVVRDSRVSEGGVVYVGMTDTPQDSDWCVRRWEEVVKIELRTRPKLQVMMA